SVSVGASVGTMQRAERGGGMVPRVDGARSRHLTDSAGPDGRDGPERSARRVRSRGGLHAHRHSVGLPTLPWPARRAQTRRPDMGHERRFTPRHADGHHARQDAARGTRSAPWLRGGVVAGELALAGYVVVVILLIEDPAVYWGGQPLTAG